MSQSDFVEIRLQVATTPASVAGTAASPGLPAEAFRGWLELTAAVARILADAERSAADAAAHATEGGL